MAWQEYVYEKDPQTQINRLLQGVDVWNRWREGNPMIFVDLSHANLSGVNLSGYNLHRTYLTGVDLSHANLSGADLSRAELIKAQLSGADLSGAKLSRALLSGARLVKANLTGTDLSGTYLGRANLSGAIGTSQEQLAGAKLYVTMMPDGSVTRFLWDGRLWTLVNQDVNTVTLVPEQGEPLQLSAAFFIHLLNHTHTIGVPYPEAGTEPAPEVQALLSDASQAEVLKAHERFLLVSAYLVGETKQLSNAQVSAQTIQRWVSAFQSARLRYGVGYVGLLLHARNN